MKKHYKIITKVLLLVIVIFIIGGANLFFHKTPKLCFDHQCFTLEIANTSELRSKGLMNRTYLPENNGMVFVFDKEEKHPFRMQDTLIDLDMIRLDSQFQVVDIANAIPCQKDTVCHIYQPDTNAKYVLEIKGGKSNQIGLKKGDTMVKKGNR